MRVNRDILFDSPYQPMQADPRPMAPEEYQLRLAQGRLRRRWTNSDEKEIGPLQVEHGSATILEIDR